MSRNMDGECNDNREQKEKEGKQMLTILEKSIEEQNEQITTSAIIIFSIELLLFAAQKDPFLGNINWFILVSKMLVKIGGVLHLVILIWQMIALEKLNDPFDEKTDKIFMKLFPDLFEHQLKERNFHFEQKACNLLLVVMMGLILYYHVSGLDKPEKVLFFPMLVMAAIACVLRWLIGMIDIYTK